MTLGPVGANDRSQAFWTPGSPTTIAWIFAALIAAGAIIAAAVSQVWPLAAFAVGPLACAAWLQWLGIKPLRARLTDAAIVLEDGRPAIPYDSLLAVIPLIHAAERRPARFPIVVDHQQGMLYISERVNLSSEELYQKLLGHLPAVVPNIDPRLTSFLEGRMAAAGAESSVIFFARPHSLHPRPPPAAVAAIVAGMFALALVGIILGVTGVAHEACAVLGVAGVVLGGLIGLLSALQGRHGRAANCSSATLVVSPVGLALAQGELVGELRWDEVRQIKLAGSGYWSGDRIAGARLELHVAGVVINVYDLYNQPLHVIKAAIEKHLTKR